MTTSIHDVLKQTCEFYGDDFMNLRTTLSTKELLAWRCLQINDYKRYADSDVRGIGWHNRHGWGEPDFICFINYVVYTQYSMWGEAHSVPRIHYLARCDYSSSYRGEFDRLWEQNKRRLRKISTLLERKQKISEILEKRDKR